MKIPVSSSSIGNWEYKLVISQIGNNIPWILYRSSGLRLPVNALLYFLSWIIQKEKKGWLLKKSINSFFLIWFGLHCPCRLVTTALYLLEESRLMRRPGLFTSCSHPIASSWHHQFVRRQWVQQKKRRNFTWWAKLTVTAD